MKLLTANRLSDGVVVWYGHDQWHEDIGLAQALDDDRALALHQEKSAEETLWVGVYLIDLDAAGQPIKREQLREFIRAQGPTIGQTAFDTAKAHDRDLNKLSGGPHVSV